MSASGLELGGELSFEHVGTLQCEGKLLLCDVEYFDPKFAGMRRGKVELCPELELMPGAWQVLIVREADPAGELRFVLLAHDEELGEGAEPLAEAEALALVRIDSGRITALDAELREDEVIATALIEAPREQVPCMLTAPGDEHARGVLLDVDVGGVFELYAGVTRPRSSLFLAL